MLMLLIPFIFVVITITLSLVALRCWILYLKKNSLSARQGKQCIGFFHPYCNAGGGGERVLWAAVRALQLKYPDKEYVVYTGDCDATPEEIIGRAKTRFDISIPSPLKFIFLKKRYLVEAKMYPVFTLLGQSIGSIFLGIEALLKLVPDIYIDTMGYSFTMPLFKIFGSCKVGCYVHYPTISTDMLAKVSEQQRAHNNRQFISRNPVLSKMKILYYKFFAFLYKLVGRTSDVILVNSSWTKGHILNLWQARERTFLVYPPCNVGQFNSITRETSGDSIECRIVSVAQFRPEKDHLLQINAFAKFWNRLNEERQKKSFLVLVGSCRTEEDLERVAQLQRECRRLQVDENILFKLNVSFEELKKEMVSASIALHTMWNEHFGIGVVEGMAAGLLTVAHDSGGPKMDIVIDYDGNPTGFLASDEDSFAEAFEKIINLPEHEKLLIRKNAKDSVKRFSDEKFLEAFLSSVELLFI